jgi:hypothetical protein
MLMLLQLVQHNCWVLCTTQSLEMMYKLTGMGEIVALSTSTGGDGPHGRNLSPKKGKKSKKGLRSKETPAEELKDCDDNQVGGVTLV